MHTCGKESHISLIVQIYKIHNPQPYIIPSSMSMFKEKYNFRDCVVCRFPGSCERISLG
jgi:hypothetical protein